MKVKNEFKEYKNWIIIFILKQFLDTWWFEIFPFFHIIDREILVLV